MVFTGQNIQILKTILLPSHKLAVEEGAERVVRKEITMTRNQIAWFEASERQRNNMQTERETQRSNRARELETNRANLVNEAETNRHNLATERLQGDYNVSYLKELGRSNLAKESIQKQQNSINQANIYLTNARERDRISETRRSNLANEGITSRRDALSINETRRSNLAKEGISARQTQNNLLAIIGNREAALRNAETNANRLQYDIKRTGVLLPYEIAQINENIANSQSRRYLNDAQREAIPVDQGIRFLGAVTGATKSIGGIFK